MGRLRWWKILYCARKTLDGSTNSAVWTRVVFLSGTCAQLIYSFIIWGLHKSSVTVEEFTSGRRGCRMFTPESTARRVLRFDDSSPSPHFTPLPLQNPRLICVSGPNRSFWCRPSFPCKDTRFPMNERRQVWTGLRSAAKQTVSEDELCKLHLEVKGNISSLTGSVVVKTAPTETKTLSRLESIETDSLLEFESEARP